MVMGMTSDRDFIHQLYEVTNFALYHLHSDSSGWSELLRLFDAVEAHLRVRLANRDLADSPVYQQTNDDSSPDWPLLQALLQVNLLPFALTANLQLLIEV